LQTYKTNKKLIQAQLCC